MHNQNVPVSILSLVLASCMIVQANIPAWAQDAAPELRQSVPGGQSDVLPSEQAAAGLWDRANLFGDPAGLRASLARRGIAVSAQETSEVFGNPTGGTRRAVIYEGLTQLSLGVDTGKAFGWPGGTINVSALQIHGRGLSANALGNNLHTVSSLEAQRGALLFELWYEQVLFGGAAAIRIGQLAADQEFMTSKYAALFLNHTFGWSSHPSADLPSGGPSYPLATPGIRVRLAPTPAITLLAAAFNGDPAGPGTGTPQDRNPSGIRFRLGDGVLALLEMQVAADIGGQPGVYKLGGWYNSQAFPDQRRNSAGDSLADPDAVSPAARSRRGDFGLYGVADQLVWRPAPDGDRGIGVFLRAMGSPGDRNLINAYVDAGVTWKGAFARRPDDTAGLAVGYARYSDTVAKLDSDLARFAGAPYPIRRNETVLEATYQAQIAPWWQVQPTAQYVFNLNGGVPDPRRPGKRLGDAVVLGLRTAVTF